MHKFFRLGLLFVTVVGISACSKSSNDSSSSTGAPPTLTIYSAADYTGNAPASADRAELFTDADFGGCGDYVKLNIQPLGRAIVTSSVTGDFVSGASTLTFRAKIKKGDILYSVGHWIRQDGGGPLTSVPNGKYLVCVLDSKGSLITFQSLDMGDWSLNQNPDYLAPYQSHSLYQGSFSEAQ